MRVDDSPRSIQMPVHLCCVPARQHHLLRASQECAVVRQIEAEYSDVPLNIYTRVDHVVPWLRERQGHSFHSRRLRVQLSESVNSLIAEWVEVRRILGVKAEVAVRVSSNPTVERGTFEGKGVVCNVHRCLSLGSDLNGNRLDPLGPA